jgi:hypothetical protein
MGDGRWLCQCHCRHYNLVAMRAGTLMGKHGPRSCGCLRQGWFRRHPFYRMWSAIKSRCFNPADKNYPGYGGKGITMFEAWRDFEQFIADLPPKPRTGEYSIDRINNDGSYVPGNIRWATRQQQAANRRTGLIDAKSIVVGDTNLWEACRRAGVSYSGVYYHIKKLGEDPLVALEHVGARGPSRPAKRHLVDGWSLPQACRRAGVSYHSVFKRMKTRNESAAEAIAHFAVPR